MPGTRKEFVRNLFFRKKKSIKYQKTFTEPDNLILMRTVFFDFLNYCWLSRLEYFNEHYVILSDISHHKMNTDILQYEIKIKK